MPRDVLAMTIMLMLFIFKMTGHNGTFDVPVAIIIGYYFSRKEDHPVVVRKEDLPTV